MKKLVLFFATVAAVALASCGNKAAQTEEQVEVQPAEEVVVIEEVAPAAADSVAEVIVEEVVAAE